jgi:Domain of unknown function (DUF4157)
MTNNRIAQTKQQQKSETPQGSGILERASVRSLADTGAQSTDHQEAQLFSNSAFSKDFSRVSISNTQLQPIQAKLIIGAVGDKYEQEADRVASQVVQQISAPASAQSIQEQSVQRQEGEEEEIQAKPSISSLQMSPLPTQVQLETKLDDGLQTKSILQRQDALGGGEASTDVESAINKARGGGMPLEAGLQQSMGQAMRADFSGVKVHTDSQADQLNRSIQAKAFTTGQDVFFRQGEYNPGSQAGKELIAHELTHVVQQKNETNLLGENRQEGIKTLEGQVVQRAEIQFSENLETNDIPLIENVKIERPSGVQDDHATAWAMQKFLILVRLKGKTVDQGLEEVAKMGKELLNNITQISGSIEVRGNESQLNKMIAKAETSSADPSKHQMSKLQILGNSIDIYCRIRNNLPLAKFPAKLTNHRAESRQASKTETDAKKKLVLAHQRRVNGEASISFNSIEHDANKFINKFLDYSPLRNGFKVTEWAKVMAIHLMEYYRMRFIDQTELGLLILPFVSAYLKESENASKEHKINLPTDLKQDIQILVDLVEDEMKKSGLIEEDPDYEPMQEDPDYEPMQED